MWGNKNKSDKTMETFVCWENQQFKIASLSIHIIKDPVKCEAHDFLVADYNRKDCYTWCKTASLLKKMQMFFAHSKKKRF